MECIRVDLGEPDFCFPCSLRARFWQDQTNGKVIYLLILPTTSS